jgi:hypothetical protein
MSIDIQTVPLPSLTAHNCSNSPDYTAKNFPKLFTGRTFINLSLATAPVDSSRLDDSLNLASPANISKGSLHGFMPGWKGKIINFWQAFLYDGTHHPAVGYLNNDPAAIARQMADSASRGFDVVTLDLYGPQFPGAGNDFVLDNIALNAAATNQTFFATIDQQYLTSGTNGFKPADYQQKMVDYINHIAARYFAHPQYERFNGRPLLFFWGFSNTGLGAQLNWKAIREATHGNALFLFYQAGGFQVPTSDGAVGWMPTGPGTGDPGGLNYLKNYMLPAIAAHPDKVGISMVWARFNGTNTFSKNWSEGKFLDGLGGMTWVDGWGLHSAFAKAHSLPYVMVVWDDNQEGTALISGVDNNIALAASIQGTTLSWEVTGHEDTVAAYDVYGAVDPQNVYKLGSVPPGAAKSLDLGGKLLPYGGGPLYIQAVGKPCVVNRLLKV